MASLSPQARRRAESPLSGVPRGSPAVFLPPRILSSVSLGKLSFSVSGQEVLSTDLSPSIQASMLCR